MELLEICEHPWFRTNAPIRPVITLESLQAPALPEEVKVADAADGEGVEITRQSTKNITIEGNIDHVEY